MQVGDLVQTTGFGVHGNVGEVGIILRPSPRFPRTWMILMAGIVIEYAQDGLRVVSNAG